MVGVSLLFMNITFPIRIVEFLKRRFSNLESNKINIVSREVCIDSDSKLSRTVAHSLPIVLECNADKQSIDRGPFYVCSSNVEI
ncbi:hypothetical protein TNCT_49051 [Trichonephila clavata]|uniref:Uncharacterized protein n=1 Tax=Trichonephila clavata TaxID=2740835 RepID=A0A8X6JA95_TRICU|nr:hypothetical protein TNCT_49051 [Trichonephila clavata]